MCINALLPKAPKITPLQIAATDNGEATRQADLEAAFRRRRASAAGRFLTSPRGIPATPTLGGVAQ
jgi:hypothetical protein